MTAKSTLTEVGALLLVFSIAPVLISLAARIRPIRALARRGPAAHRAIILAAVLLSLTLNLGLYAGFAWYWARFTYAHPNLMEATCADQVGWTEKAIWITLMVPQRLREISCLDHVYQGLNPTSSIAIMHPTIILSLVSTLVTGILMWRIHQTKE
jgi:hypothetical protein